MMKTALCVLSLVLVSNVAFAGNPIQKIQSENPSASKYEVLETLFATASAPAQLSDFDLLSAKTSNMRCASVSQNSPNAVMDESVYRRYEYTYEDAVPAKGPLFPAEPAKKRWILIDDYYAESYYYSFLDRVAATATLAESNTALIELFDDSKASTPLLKNGPLKLTFMKNGNLISIQVIENLGRKNQATHYLYCWRE